MKKVFAALVLCALLPVCAFAETQGVSISLRAGQEDIFINGQTVHTAAPYIADGVTLVPLRVITEAFGAGLVWNASEQKIKLTEGTVGVELKIGNENAVVNGRAVRLEMPPEFSGDWVTMVPLRFIADTFGAEVDYSGGVVTVTRSAPEVSGETGEYKRVCVDGLNFSMNIPADYSETQPLTSGHAAFESESGRIDIDAAPKTDSAGMTAWYDFSRRLEKSGERAELSRITPRTYAAFDAFSYTLTDSEKKVRYSFFTSGDNVYRIAVSGDITEERELELMNSVIAAAPDAGFELYPLLSDGGSFTATADDCSFTLPSSYVPCVLGGYTDRTTGATLEILRSEEKGWREKLSQERANDLAKEAQSGGAVITVRPSKMDIGGKQYYIYGAEYPNGVCEYVFTKPEKKRELMFRLRVPKLYDTDELHAETEEIIASLKI